MKHKDTKVSSVGVLLEDMKKEISDSKTVWFRGQSMSDWPLVPSLARQKKHLAAEAALRKRFMQNAVPHLDRTPTTEWEWMFMMTAGIVSSANSLVGSTTQ